MPTLTGAFIVEGHGEVDAVPVLVRRIVQRAFPNLLFITPRPPFKIQRSRITHREELQKAIELFAPHVRGRGFILIVVDADDDPPCVLGPRVRELARRADIAIEVAVATREFESWFIAAAPSLPGVAGSAGPAPAAVEDIRGAKEWLSRRLGRTYKETTDQELFSRALDLDMAMAAPSFRKFHDKVIRLCESLLPQL
jgi:hypothetical protein